MFLFISLIIGLFSLETCGVKGTSNNAIAPSTTRSATPTGAFTQSVQTTIHLTHQPLGTADLNWSAQSRDLTVKITMTGLAPKSTHPAHIHAGSCTNAGKIVYPFNNVVADASGAASVTTTIKGVTGGIPAPGWYINIHNGPNMTPAIQDLPISCGNIMNPNTSTIRDQLAHVTLATASSENQSASGTAQLALSATGLTVTITLNGLAPNSAHIAHIHEGSCANQGKVIYMLQPVVANASGVGHSTTTITPTSPLPTLPKSGWYVNVHLASNADALATQTGFDPIACGDLQ